ncbi:MAG: Flp family type IVb pilin [Firmicutes bacterium]|nr:Flp family type IVb pilin [Bacillota bacterium]
MKLMKGVRILFNENGAVMTEYALLLVLIALLVAAVLPGIGESVAGFFKSVSTSF